MKKVCRRCGEMFKPSGKFSKICLDCDKRPQKLIKVKEESALHLKRVKLGLADADYKRKALYYEKVFKEIMKIIPREIINEQ